MSKHQEEFKNHETKPYKEQQGQSQEIYHPYQQKQALQRSLVYEILNTVLKVYINIQNEPDDSLDSLQYLQCVTMLLKCCFAPYLYFFSYPSQYMNPNSFCQNDIFYNQTPAQHVQNVFPPTANEFVPSFQKKNEKSNEATKTPQKGIKNNENVNRQKFGRNIISNIFHLMIKFVRRSKKIREMITQIIQKYGMAVKINEFHHIFKKMAGKVSPYATDYQMKEIWLGPEKNQNPQGIKAQKEQQCCKIFRILGRIYLERYHLAYVYNSNKIKKESKKLHCSCIRKIYMI